MSSGKASAEQVFEMGIRGARTALQLAMDALEEAVAKHGEDRPVEYPETAYELPAVYAWDGREVHRLADIHPLLEDHISRLRDEPTVENALVAGEATMIAAEVIEALRYVEDVHPYEDAGYCGFIPDKLLRELGVALVDDTIPGVAVLVGKASDPAQLVSIVRDLQSKGMLIIASYGTIDQLRDANIKMGLGMMLYPVGTGTQIVHALNFAIRGALSFGGVQRGDRETLSAYLSKRPKTFVLQFGPLDDIMAGAGLAAILNGAPVLTDQNVEDVPDVLLSVRPENMVQTAIEARDIRVKLAPVDIPVAYGPAFEGETVRRPDTYVEAGGASKTVTFELLRLRPEDEVEDGRITLIGKDVDEMDDGSSTALAIIVDVYGKKMEEDFEGVLERRIHQFINYAEGAWHTGQRNLNWIRLSRTSVKAGLTFKHFGDILITKLKEEFGGLVSRIQVTIVTDEDEVRKRLPEAMEIYGTRDARLAGLTDESVDTYYTCELCVPATEDVVLADGSFLPMDGLVEQAADWGPVPVLSFAADHMISRPTGEIFLNPSPKELIRITLGNGNDITLTANHNLLVDSAEGLKWVAAGKLQAGDCVIDAIGANKEESKASLSTIDYLPDDYKVSDDRFYNELWGEVDGKHTVAELSKRVGIPYDKLYHSLTPETLDRTSRQRLTIGELKRLMSTIGKDWDSEKEKIRVFQFNAVLNKARLDDRLLYAVGLIASDGCVVWRGENGRSGVLVHFTNSEEALTREFANIMEESFGYSPIETEVEPSISRSETLSIHANKTTTVSQVCDTIFGRLLNGLGVGLPNRIHKWTGYKISKLPDELIAAFLRGLFDGDGYITTHHLGITTRSKLEARHIHLLFKRFGIASSIRKGTRGHQIMANSDEDIVLFRQRIGSEHPDKKKKLDEFVRRQDRNHVVRSDVVPMICGDHIARLIERYNIETSKLPVDYKTVDAWRKGTVRASKGKLTLLLDALADKVPAEDSDFMILRAWSRADVRFQKVKETEQVSSESDRVFNFSVDDTHNYAVNGIVVKNCQSFAPDHICVITPERMGLCGALNWLDARASKEIAPTGPNQPIVKGECIDPVKGQFVGVNEVVYEASHHKIERFNAYSLMEDPMTSCGCFEVIVAMAPDMQSVVVVNREYPGMIPLGMKFSSLAGSVGGGRQTPGFIGAGRKYITSRKFISADGGFLRISWMPRELKESMREALDARAKELGEPDFVDKIADETVTTDAEGLMEWMAKVDHPALRMPPLLS